MADELAIQVRQIRPLLTRLARLVAVARDQWQDHEQRLDLARDRILTIEERLDTVEARRVVQVVAELPATAPAHLLLRTPTDRGLYMGNGPGQPLSHFKEVIP